MRCVLDSDKQVSEDTNSLREAIEKKHEEIREWFNNHVFLLILNQEKQMTACEIAQRN